MGDIPLSIALSIILLSIVMTLSIIVSLARKQ